MDATVRDGTVTVDLHVYAAVDVNVTVGDLEPDMVGWNEATLRHVFHSVPSGTHQVIVADVMGFSETREITVLDVRPQAHIPPALLEYDITVDPPAPSAGDSVRITVVTTLATGMGRKPQYWLLGAFEPFLILESPRYLELNQFGEPASWRLVASDAGAASVSVGIIYETTSTSEDGEALHRLANDKSSPFTVLVKPR